jgi:hypothetical protein
MTDALRDRLRGVVDGEAPRLDMRRVARRARTLRIRRTLSWTLALMLAGAGVAIPLTSLRDLGRTKAPQHTAPAGPTFGDGSVSFQPRTGWSLLQTGAIWACATTATFARQDLSYPRSNFTDPNSCRATAAALPADGVLVSAYASDPYRWERPNINFPSSSLPPTLDPSTCGAATYEGQPPGTTECHAWITANDRQLAISVWFGTQAPSTGLLSTAQEGLDAMVVSEPASLGNDLAFEPATSWYDQAVTGQGNVSVAQPSAWTSNVRLAQFDNSYFPAGPSNNDIRSLPADGVIVSVEQWIATRNPLPDTSDFQPLPDPPVIGDGRLITGGWEGMAAQDISQLYLRGVVNGRAIIVQAYFHTTDPSRDLVQQAQFALNRLVVVPVPPPTTRLDDFGISMEVPNGWHGWLYALGDQTLVATTSDPSNPFYPANVVQKMGPGDVTIVLGAGGALQDLRWPPIDAPPHIGPENLCVGCEMMDGGQPPSTGHVLYHNTFTSGGRAFDLYVEFGSAPSSQQVVDVNATLQTLRIAPDPNAPSPPAGGTAVGSLYDGAKPAVTSDDANRTLSWTYEGRTSLSVPVGWTGWTNLVPDPSDPIELYALGSWDVPQGGYCAPVMALQQLPSDGALIWIDRYEHGPPQGILPTSWPSSPRVGPGTEPAASPTECTAGVAVQSFLWTLDGRTYEVHAAFGPAVTDTTVRAAADALGSFSAGG